MIRSKPFLFLFGLLLGYAAFSMFSHAATMTATIPDGTCPTIAGYIVTCTPNTQPPIVTPPPVVTPPGPVGGPNLCGTNGYNYRPVDVPYPVTGNTQGQSGQFGNSDAVVVHFRTPPLGVNDQAVFQPAGFPPTQGTTRVATLGTAPCLFPTSYNATGAALGTVVSQTPAINIHIGTCTAGGFGCSGFYLQPSTDYYITLTNRTNIGAAGQPSCSAASCPMRLDFNH